MIFSSIYVNFSSSHLRLCAVLLRKLTDATSGKSEDAKAPLKAVRNAIDTIVSS